MLRFLSIISIFVFLCFFGVGNVLADDVLTFHFFQNGESLSLDSAFSSPIVSGSNSDISIIDFAESSQEGEYRIDFIDVSSSVAVSYYFSGKASAFSYEFPHFGIVNAYKIYSTKDGSLLLQGSLEEFVRCNANNVCEYEKGETLDTCLADCVSGEFSPETEKLLEEGGGVIRNEEGEVILKGAQETTTPLPIESSPQARNTNFLVLGISSVVIIFVGIGIGVIIRLRRQNRQYGL